MSTHSHGPAPSNATRAPQWDPVLLSWLFLPPGRLHPLPVASSNPGLWDTAQCTIKAQGSWELHCSICLSFLICKVGIKIAPPHRVVWGGDEKGGYLYRRMGLALMLSQGSPQSFWVHQGLILWKTVFHRLENGKWFQDDSHKERTQPGSLRKLSSQ